MKGRDGGFHDQLYVVSQGKARSEEGSEPQTYGLCTDGTKQNIIRLLPLFDSLRVLILLRRVKRLEDMTGTGLSEVEAAAGQNVTTSEVLVLLLPRLFSLTSALLKNSIGEPKQRCKTAKIIFKKSQKKMGSGNRFHGESEEKGNMFVNPIYINKSNSAYMIFFPPFLRG